MIRYTKMRLLTDCANSRTSSLVLSCCKEMPVTANRQRRKFCLVPHWRLECESDTRQVPGLIIMAANSRRSKQVDQEHQWTENEWGQNYLFYNILVRTQGAKWRPQRGPTWVWVYTCHDIRTFILVLLSAWHNQLIKKARPSFWVTVLEALIYNWSDRHSLFRFLVGYQMALKSGIWQGIPSIGKAIRASRWFLSVTFKLALQTRSPAPQHYYGSTALFRQSAWSKSK